jgi:tripartite-type tricarboxylate transporter receptor subunit TctC
MGRRWTAFAAALAMTMVAGLSANAQSWPDRTVKLVVPYPPGGNVDGAARIIGERLQAHFGQPFVIENKAGAGGLIGAESVAKADPDGYTLLVGANGPILFAPEMASRRAYEWRRDFFPVSAITLTPIVLQVHPSVKAASLKEFIELAKAEPGKLRMSAPGPGTTNHLISELMQQTLGLSWVTVQYRGNAPATNDLIGGHVQFNLDQLSVSLPFIRDGRTRALAITGAARARSLPDVATFAELGFPQFDGQTFTGMMAPAKTPADIVAKLHAGLTKVLGEPEVQAKIAALGANAAPMTQEAFRAYLEKEDATWIPLIRKLNIKQE